MKAIPAGKFTPMVLEYVNEKLGTYFEQDLVSAFMVMSDQNDFVAAVVFSNYRDHDVDITCVSETPAAWRRNVLKAVFTYAFVQCGCVRITAITTKANKKARDFNEALGFKLEGNARLGYDGKRDALIYGLLRSECRFLEEDTDGQELEQAAACS